MTTSTPSPSPAKEAGGQWMPIESAPKDGYHFWAYQHGSYYECWWYDDWPQSEGYWMDFVDSNPEPTHWMTLPDPPR